MPPNQRILLEVATPSPEGALIAQQNGANRIELNTALELGGLTPSHALLQQTLAAVNLPVIVMLRPRAGGFIYSASEFTTLQRDADHALAQGAAGVAFGLLTEGRRIDLDRTRQLVRQAAPAQTVFHRAFDLLPNPVDALEQLIDLGLTRILTSGGHPTAPEGAAVIAQILQHANSRIEILPAAGIRPENAVELLRQTRCNQLHGTFSTKLTQHAHPVGPGEFPVTDAQQIRDIRALLDNYSPAPP
jgi:copper homeostasis protein